MCNYLWASNIHAFKYVAFCKCSLVIGVPAGTNRDISLYIFSCTFGCLAIKYNKNTRVFPSYKTSNSFFMYIDQFGRNVVASFFFFEGGGVVRWAFGILKAVRCSIIFYTVYWLCTGKCTRCTGKLMSQLTKINWLLIFIVRI